MKNNRVRVIIFLAILILPSLLWGMLRAIAPNAYEKLIFDTDENRALTEISSASEVFQNTGILSDYYSDHAPFRSSVLSFYKSATTRLERPYDDVISPRVSAVLYAKYAQNKLLPCEKTLDPYLVLFGRTGREEELAALCEKPSTETYMSPKTYGDVTILGRDKWLFLYGDGNIHYYTAANIMSAGEMQDKFEAMKRLQNVCDDRGITLLYVVYPAKEQVYAEFMPDYSVKDSYKRLARFTDYVNEHSEMTMLYPLSELCSASLLYRTYRKYDTHWNQMGAYVGEQVLLKALSEKLSGANAGQKADIANTLPQTVNPLTLTVTTQEAEPGDLVKLGFLDPTQYTDDFDYIIEYRPEVEVVSRSEGKRDLLDVYHSLSTADCEARFVLIGDSYRTRMIPYLEKDFSSVTVAHRDRLEDVAEDIRNADILVVEATERYDNDMILSINRLVEVLK